MRLIQPVLALLLVSLLGCSQHAATTSDQGSMPSMAALQAALPELPTGAAEEALSRAASAQPVIYPAVKGTAWLQASPAVFADQDAAVIPSPGGGMSYALYEAQIGGCQLNRLTLTMDIVGGEAWIALPNYQTGRWEFDGPLTQAPADYVMEDPKYYSPQGRVYFALIAWDGAQVTLDYFRCQIEGGDPVMHTLTEVGSETYTTMAEVGGYPAVAYYSQDFDTLYYTRAKNETPASSADWAFMKVDIGDGAGLGCDIAVINGKPVIAYAKATTGEVRFAWSDVSQPSAMTDWHSVSIGTGKYYWPTLTNVGGQPVLAFYENDSADSDVDGELGYLCIATHSGADFSDTGSWAAYRAADSGSTNCSASISSHNGFPGVAFIDSGTSELRYGRADAAAPGPGNWSFHGLALPTAPGGRCRLLYFDGVPAVSTRDVANSLYYLYANGPLPAAPMDWHGEFLAANLPSHSSFDIASINGLPSVLHTGTSDFVTYFINMQRFLNYDLDTSLGQYTITLGVDGGEGYGQALSLASLNGGPMFCFYVPDGQGGGSIKYGRIAYEMGN